MAAPFQDNVPFVADGEPVSAGVANRPGQVLQRNARYLKDRVDSAELGESVVAYGATCSPDTLVGMPVYFNPESDQFEPALAAVEGDAATHTLVTARSADVVGVVRAKGNSTEADIVLVGRTAIDLTYSAGPDAPAGRYYLSGGAAGTLELARPPVGVPVLFYDGNGTAYVLPAITDLALAHVHYRIDLVCKPAGTASDPGSGVHVITSPDPDLPGWLPAGHARFDGRAPLGAAFGYNIAAHPELHALFPPLPASSAVLFLDKGTGRVGGTAIPLGTNGLAVVDRYGIWWMSNCYGDVPWPTSYNSASPPAPIAPNASTPECPRLEAMRLVLSFTEMLFANDRTVVTSLQPAEGSPITVVDCDGAMASTGDLFLGLDLAFLTDDDNIAGARVFKALDGVTFKRGLVVEKLVAGANVTLTPTVGTTSSAQGTVTIDVVTDLSERELPPQIVRLDDAKERFHADVPYLGFPADRRSAVRFRFNVPPVGLPASPQVVLRLTVYGNATGTLPETATSYRRLARPEAPAMVALAAADSDAVLDTNLAITAGNYIEVASDPIDVAAGDTLLVTFRRGADDGYSGELGLIRVGAVLVAGAP